MQNFIIKRQGLAAVLAAVVFLCTACGGQVSSGESSNVQSVQPQEQQTQQPEEQEPEGQVTGEQATAEQTSFSFADVADLEFYFSSGAGGWRTVLHIHDDGSFDGVYSDSDMGSNGNEYPNGTVYYSEFFGNFTEPEPVDAYTWRFQIDQLEYAHEFGEVITDGFRYIYSDAYGLAGAEELHIYLPGVPIAQLPEAYRSWVGYYNLEAIQETELPFYGLYNVTEENGFSSYHIPSPADQIRDRVSATEIVVKEIEAQLQEAFTQADMNILSGEIYQAWDDTLNAIWATLKEELDADAMQQLTAEQLYWIAEKEAAVQAAAAGVEGGSMYPMVANGEAARWTRERVYVLAEYLQ